MQVDLVRTQTQDGLRLDGALLTPLGEPCTSFDAVLCLPGVGSNFYGTGLLEKISPVLRGLGLHVLWANTRGHDSVYTAFINGQARRQGAAYEIVAESQFDIAAWAEFLARQGCRRIVLFGHSLGANKAVYTLAHQPPPGIAALVAASPPRLSYAAFIAAGAPGFMEAMHPAEKLVAAGQGGQLIEVTFPHPMLITAAAYVDKYGRAERYNLTRFVNQLPCPALFTYGGEELESGGIPFAGLPEILQGLKRPDQQLDVITIPAANHMYVGKQDLLAEEIAKWLKELLAVSG